MQPEEKTARRDMEYSKRVTKRAKKAKRLSEVEIDRNHKKGELWNYPMTWGNSNR